MPETAEVGLIGLNPFFDAISKVKNIKFNDFKRFQLSNLRKLGATDKESAGLYLYNIGCNKLKLFCFLDMARATDKKVQRIFSPLLSESDSPSFSNT
jgi:hypothetical protein